MARRTVDRSSQLNSKPCDPCARLARCCTCRGSCQNALFECVRRCCWIVSAQKRNHQWQCGGNKLCPRKKTSAVSKHFFQASSPRHHAANRGMPIPQSQTPQQQAGAFEGLEPKPQILNPEPLNRGFHPSQRPSTCLLCSSPSRQRPLTLMMALTTLSARAKRQAVSTSRCCGI